MSCIRWLHCANISVAQGQCEAVCMQQMEAVGTASGSRTTTEWLVIIQEDGTHNCLELKSQCFQCIAM